MDTVQFNSTVEEVINLTSNVQEPYRVAAFQAALTVRLLGMNTRARPSSNGDTLLVPETTAVDMATTFEEYVRQLPKKMPKPDKFMAVAYWLLMGEEVKTFQPNELQEYFTRAHWSKLDNPQYVAIQCQQKGFLSPTGQKKDGYKEWKLTKTGLQYVQSLLRGEEGMTED